MRLIDADALLKALKSNCGTLCNDKNTDWCEYCCPHNDFEDLIDNATTVDAIPNEEGYEMYNKGYASGYERGKEERPHGEWITENVVKPYGVCNLCGVICEIDNFCGNCGADMRGAE